MNEIKTIIELLEKIRQSDKKAFDACPEVKLMTDAEYSQLYQMYWQADIRLGQVIDLLKAINR